MNNSSGFKKSRETFTVQIRKQNRQDIFFKFRKSHLQSAMENEGSVLLDSHIVLDENMRTLIESCHRYEFTSSQIQQLCEGLNAQSHQIRHQATIGLRKLLSEEEIEPYLQIIIDKGVISKLINLIQDRKYPQLQFQACWIITNIAYSSSPHCESIVQQNGIQVIMQLLYQNSGPVIDQALWGLGNIAGDSINSRNKVIVNGGVQCVLRIIQYTASPQTMKLSCWVLSNMCRGEPVPKYELIKKAIVTLSEKIALGMLQSHYLTGALWSLCLHSQGSKSKIRAIISVENLVTKLIELCCLSEHQIVIPSLRILGNISTGNSSQTDQLLNNNILQLLERLVENEKRSIRRQACWILSNIAAGTQNQVQRLVSYPNLVKRLTEKLLTDQYDVRRQVCFIFGNVCHLGKPQTIFQVIVQFNLLEALGSLLQLDQDHKLLQASVKCLYEFLVIGSKVSPQNTILKNVERMPSILDKIESLQHHISDDVYKQVCKLLQRFFTMEERIF